MWTPLCRVNGMPANFAPFPFKLLLEHQYEVFQGLLTSNMATKKLQNYTHKNTSKYISQKSFHLNISPVSVTSYLLVVSSITNNT